MKHTVTETMFIEAFAKAGRSDQFSVDARQALYAYYSDLESETGEEVELDVVAICCEWAEYTLDELRQDYPASDRQALGLGEGHGAVSHGSPLRAS